MWWHRHRGSRGKGGGEEVKQVNSHVDAGNKLSVVSGNDTTISGAVLRGRQVELDVGTSGQGNLNIASQQDTSTYQSRQQSLGGSVSVGMGKMGGSASYSSSRTNSNYASVMEQSGVKAGDGGFQINVRGNTDLKGAVIASSDQAVADNKNRLTTQTLTQSDIKNTAEYDAQSVGVGMGYSTGKSNSVGRDQQGNVQTGGARVPGTDLPTTGKDGGFSATPPVVMGADGSSSSVTRSGISGGIITITDEKKQQELTGKTAEQTVASVNRDVSTAKDGSNALKPIFDEAQIQNSYAIVSALTREMGTFVTNRAREADDKITAAKDPNSSLTMDQRQALLNEATEIQQNWGHGGAYRQITTALVAGIGGNVTGSVGELVQAATVNYLQSLSAKKVKTIADEIKSEPARAALHAIVACAGASAQGANCAAGAMGASASSLLGWALGSTEGMTAEERQARLNVVTNLVSGLASTGAQAAATGNAAIIEAENNQVALPPSVLPPIILPGNQKIPSGKPPGYVPTIEEQIEAEDRGKPIYNGSPSGPLINVSSDTLPTVDDFVRGMAALCKSLPLCNGLNIITQTREGGADKGSGTTDTGMIGRNGPQFPSKTIWRGSGKERIDVENPNPGQRPGQLHYQDNNGNKYLYDPGTNTFPDAPNSVNKLLSDPSFTAAIQKGMNKYLGGNK